MTTNTRSANTRQDSFHRLRNESWANDPSFVKGLVVSGGTLQSMTAGSGKYVYDEYSIEVSRMPEGTTAEEFLVEMLTDLNGTVNDSVLDVINIFKRRTTEAASIGEIIDIDIMGPDNGSVALAVSEPHFFVFQTVTTSVWNTGSHPEYGARESGFEELPDGGYRLYTRGVSRPANALVGAAGAGPQQTGWTRLMRGLSDTIDGRGGATRAGSFCNYKSERAD